MKRTPIRKVSDRYFIQTVDGTSEISESEYRIALWSIDQGLPIYEGVRLVRVEAKQ